MNLEKLNLVELDAQEVQETEGGMTVEQLLWAAWVNTPNGGSSLWVNNGSGTFWGNICYNGGCAGYGYINTNTGNYASAWPGYF